MIKAALLALALGLPALSPVHAETQDDVLSAEILPGWRTAQGHYMAALSLTLAPQWKTYWRAPGEAGIPPVFDWTGSQNIGQVQFHWPSPQVITLNGMRSIGYLERLVLPFEVAPQQAGQPANIRLHVDLGICHDVCMPASLDLAADLSGPGAPDPAIVTALADNPKSPAEAGLQGIACKAAPIDDGMRLTALVDLPRQGKAETVIFETADANIWVSEATSAREGSQLTASSDLVPSNGQPFALDRSGVTVTVLTEGHSVEIKGCPAP